MKIMNSHSGVFNNVDNLFALSVLHGTLDPGKAKIEQFKEKHTMFVDHLNGQASCLRLRYFQFVCVLFIAIIKFIM